MSAAPSDPFRRHNEAPDLSIRVDRLDHLVLTVADVEKSCAFYHRVLGMSVVVFGGGRKALTFGRRKINLHAQGSEFEPKADRPTPGSADLCFITDVPLTEVIAHLNAEGVAIAEDRSSGQARPAPSCRSTSATRTGV